MSEFFEILAIYWQGFSSLSQNLIASIATAMTGRELAAETTHWIFYGALLAIMVFLIRMRAVRIKHEIDTRRRFEI